MKKGIILNFKQLKLLDYVLINKIFIILCAFFIAGIIIGSLLYDDSNFLMQNTKVFFDSFIKTHTNNRLFSRFFICCIKYILVLVLYFLSGASMLGVAITPFITIWQGIIIGSVTSYLYSSYNLYGIAFNAIVFIPPLCIFTVCSFFAAKQSIDLSLSIARLTLPKSRPVNLYVIFKNYSIKYLVFIGIILLCVIIEIILNVLFLKFFNF